jgi:hypothetical protein
MYQYENNNISNNENIMANIIIYQWRINGVMKININNGINNGENQ